MVDLASIPGLMVANGKARYGTKVQVLRDGMFQKGTAIALDYDKQQVNVAFDNGLVVLVNAAEVHRLYPHAPPVEELRRSASLIVGPTMPSLSSASLLLAAGHGTEFRRSMTYDHTPAPFFPIPTFSFSPLAAVAPPQEAPGYLNTKADYDMCLLTHPTVIIDFTAAWCGPCKAVAPKFQELAKQYPGAVFKKVDVDENADAAGAVGVTSMPTFVAYKGGQVREKITGASASKLEDFVRRNAM